ncbi:MAG: amidohydrolase [Acidimicrobiales bacterium]
MAFDLLITEVAAVVMDGRSATVTDADLAIERDRIAAVEPAGTIDPGRAADVWAGEGLLALPGFVNTHAHTAMTLFRGVAEDVTIERWFNDHVWPMESNLTDDDVYWGALLGLAEMIEAGVTTVADHYFSMDAVARAVEEAGTRAVLAPGIFGTGPDPEAEIDEATRVVERWQGAAGGRVTVWLGPHSPYLCPRSVLEAVAARARDLGVGTHIHVSETADQVTASRREHGKTPIEVLAAAGLFASPTLCAHAAWATAEDVARLAAEGASVAHCPKTSMKLALGAAPVVALREAGVAVGLGTDGPASNNTLDILEAMRLAALLHKHTHVDPEGLSVDEVVAMGSAEGARALRLGDVGALAAGQRADVVLIRTDGVHVQPRHNPLANLVYSARATDVDTVLCDGRVLMRHRQLLTLDKAAIVAEVAGRVDRLRRPVPGQRVASYPDDAGA